MKARANRAGTSGAMIRTAKRSHIPIEDMKEGLVAKKIHSKKT
jgi:hypothetical protein